MARVLDWNGRNLPRELRELPAGQYVIAEYHPRKLTADEEQGIRQALRSIDEGKSKPWPKVRAELDEMLARKRRRRPRRK